MRNLEKAARLARLLIAGSLIVGLVPTAAFAARRVLPELTIASVSSPEGNSGTTAMTFTATLSRASTTTVTAKYATASGTATSGSDFSAATGGLSFAAGQTSKTITVNVNGDTNYEPNETFTLALSGAKGARIRGGAATGTINNDDAAPNLSIDDISVVEGNSGVSNAVFTVSLSSPATSPVSVDYLTNNGTAVAPADYSTTTGSLSFAAGETAKTVSVPVVGDTIDEDDETFNVKIQNAVGAAVSKSTGSATAVDDDFMPTIAINDVLVTELPSGDTTALFTVQLSGASAQTVTVNYATADGTATQPSDYTQKSGSLSFAPGVLTQQIPVTIKADADDEDPEETFTVTLSGPANGTLGDASGTATIYDEDATRRVSISDVVVQETDATEQATFTLTLSHANPSAATTVDVTTDEDTALAGSDFTAKTETVTIPAGELSGTFTVDVTGDDRDEPVQQFYADITAISGAVAADPSHDWGTATVVDDDSPPTVSIANASTREGDKGTKAVVLTLTLSGVSEKDIQVGLRTAPGTAKFVAGDYNHTTATVPFQDGETTYSGPFSTVLIRGDRKLEGNEFFYANLQALTNVSGAGDMQGKITILNNDVAVTMRGFVGLSKVTVKGFVRPPHKGVRMVVRYYKKRANGTWALLSTKRPALSAAADFNGDGKKESKYATAFTRRSGTRCKIVAKFPGDAHHRAGSAKGIFSC